MYIDINFIQGKGMNCYEGIMATLATYFKRDYRMAFVDTWNFSFNDKQEINADSLAENINAGVWNIENLMEKYVGINLVWHQETDAEKIIECVKKELKIGNPVVTFLSDAWNPWISENEKRTDAFGTCIINGINEEENILYCIDVHTYKMVDKIALDVFKKGCRDYATVEVLPEKGWDVDLKERLVNNIQHICDRSKQENPVDAILQFAESYEKDSHLVTNENKLVETEVDKLKKKMEELWRGRSLFAMACESFCLVNQIPNYEEFKDLLNNAEANWNIIKALLVKAQYKQAYNSTLNEKILKHIRMAAVLEEKAANAFLQDSKQVMEESDKVCELENTRKPSDYVYLNIADYCNNKGIFSNNNETENVDMTGLGEYIIENESLQQEVIVANNMQFRLPQFAKTKKDNIACDGEKICVEKGYYSRIALLGCSEWGCFSGYLVVRYDDGQTEEINISFTSWIAPEPCYEETTAWEGELSSGILIRKSCKLFAKEYVIKARSRVEEIILPVCSNMHIFAITLR